MPPQVVHVKNASKVASALSNEKCQRILDYLGKREDATESKMAKDLGIALSTIHYNMKVLVDAQLVLDDEYTYSPKGKEVTHYRVNKNPIVIVQEESQLDLLKAITPAAIIAAGIGFGITLWQKHLTNVALIAAPSPQMAMMKTAAAENVGTQLMAANQAIIPVQTTEFYSWFVAGIISTLVLSFLVLTFYHWWARRITQ